MKLLRCEPAGRPTLRLDMKWPSPEKAKSSKSTCVLPWDAAPFISCPASALHRRTHMTAHHSLDWSIVALFWAPQTCNPATARHLGKMLLTSKNRKTSKMLEGFHSHLQHRPV